MNRQLILFLLVIVATVGVVSADTAIIYAVHDGYAGGSSATWSVLNAGNGGSQADNVSYSYLMWLRSTTTTDVFTYNHRSMTTYDTSVLHGATITCATAMWHLYAGSYMLGGDGELAIVNATPSNPLDIISSDYQNAFNLTAGEPNEIAPRVPWTGHSNGWHINATLYDTNYINKDGYTTIGALDGDNVDCVYSGNWVASSSYWNYVRIYGVGLATAASPLLQVTFTPSEAPVASFTSNVLTSGSENHPQLAVGFADTSEHVAQSWQWNFTNVTGNNTPVTFSTSQNPSIIFDNGNWSIVLTATNGAGSDSTDPFFINITECISGQCGRRFYPSVIGSVWNGTDTTDWDSMRNSQIGDGATIYAGGIVYMPRLSTKASDIWDYLYRGAIGVPTALLPDDATIQNVSWSAYVNSISESFVAKKNITLTGGTLLSATTLYSGDYRNCTDVIYSDSKVQSDLITNEMNHWYWTAAGIANISKTGQTTFFMRYMNDALDSNEWENTKTAYTTFANRDDSTTTKRPSLMVNYTISGGGGTPPDASFTVDRTLTRIPKAITCTDTSTESPTGWEWSWGDGTANTTGTATPSHTYTKRGKYNIDLTVTNAYGSDSAATATVIVEGYENQWY